MIYEQIISSFYAAISAAIQLHQIYIDSFKYLHKTHLQLGRYVIKAV